MNEYYAWVRRERRNRMIAAVFAWIVVVLAGIGLAALGFLFVIAVGLA